MTLSPRTSPPAVERQPPHRNLLKVVNPVLTAVLRSPAHRLLSGFRPRLLALRVTGRHTVVGRHEIDGALSVFTSAAWRLNLQAGADLEVIDAGRTYTAHAVLVQDADEVADAYASAIRLMAGRPPGGN